MFSATRLADQVLEVARAIETKKPAEPGFKAKVDIPLRSHGSISQFRHRGRFASALLSGAGRRTMVEDSKDGIQPELTTVLLNGEHGPRRRLGRVLLQSLESPETAGLHSAHSVFRLLQRPPHVFPDHRSASEGGYGGDPPVSPVQIGAGEVG